VRFFVVVFLFLGEDLYWYVSIVQFFFPSSASDGQMHDFVENDEILETLLRDKQTDREPKMCQLSVWSRPPICETLW
jgi:hypothetical protein